MGNSNTNIKLIGLKSGYGTRVLTSIPYLELNSGEFTALIGRNGTGKSTILRIIAGLMRPVEGDVMISDRPLSSMTRRDIAEHISFVSTEDIKMSNLRVRDVVGLGRAPYTNWIGYLSTRDINLINDSLDQVGMGAFGEKNISTLSDGERQRVMIARALAQDTPIILLDEPTAFLDVPNKYEIAILLRRLSHENDKLVLFSTHDLNIAMQTADKIAVMSNGSINCGTPHEMLQHGGIQSLFNDTQLILDPSNGEVRIKKSDFFEK